jgi:hypothetical protein
VCLLVAGAVVLSAAWRINQLKPAAPTVERSTFWIDTVKRGPMVRDVQGIGTLVPEDIEWIQAEFDSQVSKILARSGDPVNPETVLLVLTNPKDGGRRQRLEICNSCQAAKSMTAAATGKVLFSSGDTIGSFPTSAASRWPAAGVTCPRSTGLCSASAKVALAAERRNPRGRIGFASRFAGISYMVLCDV